MSLKYLLLPFLVALAGLEFYYEMAHNDEPTWAMCTASNSQVETVTDHLLQHLHTHR